MSVPCCIIYYLCPKCGAKGRNIEYHTEDPHIGNDRVECTKCGYECSHRGSLYTAKKWNKEVVESVFGKAEKLEMVEFD